MRLWRLTCPILSAFSFVFVCFLSLCGKLSSVADCSVLSSWLSKTFLESHGANAIRQAKERRHFHYVLSDSSFVCSCMFFDLAAYDIIAWHHNDWAHMAPQYIEKTLRKYYIGFQWRGSLKGRPTCCHILQLSQQKNPNRKGIVTFSNVFRKSRCKCYSAS